MTDIPTPKKQHGGKRIAGPGKKIGAPREEGTAWLVELRILTPQEKTLILTLTPRERARILLAYTKMQANKSLYENLTL